MAINFPTSPTTNDIHSENDLSWKFNGASWIALPTPSVAGNVAYTPAGTGAVSTTVESKLRESVSVKDFGAVGDGVTDDTVAVQNAALASYTLNVPLELFDSYLISSDVEFKRPVITSASTRLLAASEGDVAPSVTVVFSRAVKIENMLFDNLNVKVTSDTENVTRNKATVRMNQFFNSNLTLGSTNIMTNGYVVSGNVFTVSDRSRWKAACTVVNAGQVSIKHNNISDYTVGVRVEPTIAFSCNKIDISYNNVLDCPKGVDIVGVTNAKVSNVTISNNTLCSATRDAASAFNYNIGIFNSVHVSISKNTMSGNSQNCRFEHSFSITACDNKMVTDGNQTCVRFISCADINIAHNNLYSPTGFTILILDEIGGAIKTGVQYTPTNVVMEYNELYGSTRSVKIENTDLCRVKSNRFYGTALGANGLLQFAGTSNGSYEDNEFYAESGTPVIVGTGTVVAGDVSQALNVITAPSATVASPIITASDTALDNAKSYVVTFTLEDYKLIHQEAGAEQTLSTWVTGLSATPQLAWNSSAFGTGGEVGMLVNDGLAVDMFGVPTEAKTNSAVIIDIHNRLSSRDFFQTAVSDSAPMLVSPKGIDEGAWILGLFRPVLIVDGVKYDPVTSGAISSSSYSTVISGRTSIGQKADGTYVLLVVDGETGVSGTTIEKCADKLLALGCENAFNLDGGGSTTLWHGGSVINSPSDAGGERDIPAFMYVE